MHRSLVLATTLALAASLPAQLAGNYTIGPAGSYPNIAAAMAALTTSGVAAPVNFTVLASDTGPWTLGAFPGQGPANPVTFDGLGTAVISGTQPVLTLNGCASVTFRGFQGTFLSTAAAIVVDVGTTDCVFTGCDFTAPSVTSGTGTIFRLLGGSGCTIEDSRFGGAYESINVGLAHTGAVIQRCRIIGGGFWIMRIAGPDCVLANNMITGTSNYGISAGISGNTSSGANIKILHNSILINHTTTGSQYCSLRWYSNPASSEVLNNIFCDLYPTVALTAFNMWCSGALRPAVMDHNCLYSNVPGYFPVFASANRTLRDWQGLGFDANSFQADPMLLTGTNTPADMTLLPGSPCSATGTPVLSVPIDHFMTARTLPVSIGAHEQEAGPAASYLLLGAGCAGSAGVPSNSISAPVRLGIPSEITFGNLPAPNMAIGVIGLSNTMSNMGPLPLSLAPLGAPGCTAHVSFDSTFFLSGSAGTAGFTLRVPSRVQFLGMVFYTQALVFDPPLNSLGASVSDAAAGIIGV